MGHYWGPGRVNWVQNGSQGQVTRRGEVSYACCCRNQNSASGFGQNPSGVLAGFRTSHLSEIRCWGEPEGETKSGQVKIVKTFFFFMVKGFIRVIGSSEPLREAWASSVENDFLHFCDECVLRWLWTAS